MMETQLEANRHQTDSSTSGASEDECPTMRGAILLRIIKNEVIPGLACKTKKPRRRRATGSASNRTEAQTGADTRPIEYRQQIDQLTELTLRASDAPLREHVEALLASGVTRTVLYGDLLAGVARRLGTMWDDDTCSFVDVTIGVGRLHEIVHYLSPSNADAASAMRAPRPSLYLMPAPGEQHIFGLLVLAEHFRACGWRVDVSHGSADIDKTADLIRHTDCDCIGITIAAERCIVPLTKVLSSLRNSSTPIKPVLIGGAACQRDPNLAKRVGADGSATNETEAVAVANSLTSSSARQPIA